MKLLAENINRTVDDDIYKSFYLEIGNKLFDTIKSSQLIADSRMNILPFSIIIACKIMGENTEFPTTMYNILYQYILDKFLKYALNYRKKQLEKEQETMN